ncbi:MAG: response regulator [Janthinobacterium lividum]
MCKLLVVDDHPVIGAALKVLLDKSSIVKEMLVATSAREAQKLIRANKFDMMVADLDLPDLAGVDLIRLIRKTDPELRILIYTSKRYEIFSNRLERLNISGFLSKSEDIGRLLSIIELAAQGYGVLPPGSTGTPREENPFDALSERELSICSLITKRYTNRTIAGILSISEKTVAVHKLNIKKKLKVSCSIDIALLAQSHKLD